MSKRRWFVLWLLFIAYLFLGATIFYSIERGLEEKRRTEKIKEDNEIEGLLLGYCFTGLLETDNRERGAQTIISRISHYCGKPLLRSPPNPSALNVTKAEPYVWTFYNSFFFSLTTLSTIGYGNLSPTSNQGKICVIIYSLIGIPLNGIVLTHLGDFFGSKFLRAHHRYKTHTYESRINLVLDILVYLIPGMGVFILVPSIIFQYFEEWTFIDSIYYSFVSLTTIGYGDFVAVSCRFYKMRNPGAQCDHQNLIRGVSNQEVVGTGQTASTSAGEVFYKIFLVIWIMFGLGYLVMILGFISRAMRSKHINKLERKVAQTLRQTQSKIWNEFVQDIHYLRRVLNELYLLKVKPVYKSRPISFRPLSQSCPNLSEWPVLRSKSDVEHELLNIELPKRRRALSENEPPRLPRVFSDGALQEIDWQATFSAANDPAGFFIGSGFGHDSEITDSDDYKEGGIHGFSDEEILASEDHTSTKNSVDMTWNIGRVPLRRAGRAMSDAQFVEKGLGHQKTWAGVESLHQIAVLKAMRAKSNEWQRDEEIGVKDFEPRSGLRRLSMAALNFFTPSTKLKKKTADISRDSEGFKKHRGGNLFGRITPKHRHSLQEQGQNQLDDIADQLNYLTHTSNRRPSILDLFATPHGTNTPISPVLEQTSIADFIRAVNSLKTLQAERSRPSSPSGAFPGNLFQTKNPQRDKIKSTISMEYNVPKERRHSHFPQMGATGDRNLFRRRAASISPMYPLVTSTDKKLKKVSTVSRVSPLNSGRVTPTTRFPPAPSVVVTSPDGHHRFSIHTVESPRPFKEKQDVKK